MPFRSQHTHQHSSNCSGQSLQNHLWFLSFSHISLISLSQPPKKLYSQNILRIRPLLAHSKATTLTQATTISHLDHYNSSWPAPYCCSQPLTFYFHKASGVIMESHCWKYFKGHTGYNHQSPSGSGSFGFSTWASLLSSTVLRSFFALTVLSEKFFPPDTKLACFRILFRSLLKYYFKLETTFLNHSLWISDSCQLYIPVVRCLGKQTPRLWDLHAFRGTFSGTTSGREWRK